MPIKKPICDYENYDGISHEEDKAMHRKLTNPKSRWSWSFSDTSQEDWDTIFNKTKSK